MHVRVPVSLENGQTELQDGRVAKEVGAAGDRSCGWGNVVSIMPGDHRPLWGKALRRFGLSIEETLQDYLSGNAVLAALAFFL